jgi:hypothetical protein
MSKIPSKAGMFDRIALTLPLIAVLSGLSLLGGLSGMPGVAGLNLFQPETAHAADATCFDIRGDGQPVLYGVAYNSGIMAFADPYQPSNAYRACARDMGTYYQLEGWNWNTNLGWVSLYCPAGGTNQGVSCGSYVYGVTVDKDDGQFHGFAFGDNTGYVSFNCADDSNGCGVSNTHIVKSETDADCKGYIYSTSTYPTPANCPAHTAADAFAWSDGVGWFDLSGVRLPFGTSVSSLSPPTGPYTGGTDVTITGLNFAGTPTVTFGGSSATNIVLVDSTTITVTTPSGTIGPVDVVVTTLNGSYTFVDGFRYTCATTEDEQCVETSITGSITFDVPADITFPEKYSSNVDQPNYSNGATGYDLNEEDLLIVYDTRNNGGFVVQVHPTTPFENAGQTRYIPLANLYVATTSADTGGFRYTWPGDGIEYNSEPVTACDGSPLDVTPSNRATIPTVLQTVSTFTGQAMGTGYNGYTTYDIMDCSLTAGGRSNIFKQNVNYYLNIPAGQPADTYGITITFDLVT